jgi:hypothetical protein
MDRPGGLFCRPSLVLDGLSHQQRSRLLRKADPKLSEEEQWFAIWDIAFPGRARPCSAYRNAEDSEELCSFHDYCHAHGPAMLGAEIESRMQSGQWSGPELSREEVHSILGYVFEEGFDHIYEAWRSRASDAVQVDTEIMSETQLTTQGSPLPPGGLVAIAQPSDARSLPDVREQHTEGSGGRVGLERGSSGQIGPPWDDEQGQGSDWWDLDWGAS